MGKALTVKSKKFPYRKAGAIRYRTPASDDFVQLQKEENQTADLKSSKPVGSGLQNPPYSEADLIDTPKLVVCRLPRHAWSRISL